MRNLLGDKKVHPCDSGGIGFIHELDPAQYLSYTQCEGLRNIANDPEYIERARRAMANACVVAKERRYRHAIYSIKKQPFYS